MRPLRLDLAGFGVFREETTVDFTDADFFALVGPTGAGKSSILDAICFALYGTVPRWRDPRSVANALAPSGGEARVRLTFEAAGDRYVATRVVRRDSKGRVKTAGAGLQRMPAGFDIRKLDTGLTPDDLGEVLAGTPSELDRAVPQVLGLPYDQFVTCVILPQGEFAEFLHAKPATRQQILVNLLGLSVYERVRERATARAAEAEAELSATDRVLADLPAVDDDTLAQARARVSTLAELGNRVEAILPRLAAGRTAHQQAVSALQERQAQISQLRTVTAPPEATDLAVAAAAARQARSQAAEAVATAEEREEKLRGELAAGADPGTLRRLLASYQQREDLRGQREQLDAAVATAAEQYDLAAAALEQVRQEVEQAQAALERARQDYTRAQTADLAVSLRGHLSAGEPCPVCTQPVSTLPEVPADSAVTRAEAAGKQARAAADAAARRLAQQDAATRELDRSLTAARTRAEAVAAQLSQLDAELANAPAPAALEAELAAIAETEQRLTEATAGVRQAREHYRRAEAAEAEAERRLRTGWRDFERMRDSLASHQPPPADRDDLAAAWSGLAEWADSRAAALAQELPQAQAAVAAAEAAVAADEAELADAFAAAQLPAANGDAQRAAAVAAERARADLDRLQQLREQADRLATARADHQRRAHVARALAQHLRANNFEAWLLEEALDRLVEGASAILRQLSGGQYDLVHEDREFFVVDHHDASLRRPVRTLSGGETFQASLALALALSEQLAGMSTTSASLESIMLDEGFGTLDAATLDAVAAALENLAARGDRVVGVVTHVPALAERIPVRYEVSKDSRSARVTRVGA